IFTLKLKKNYFIKIWGLACYVTSDFIHIFTGHIICDQVVKAKLWSFYAKVKHSKGTFQSYPHMETITIKESDFLANGTDSNHEENCESDFEEVGVAICKL
ncbi:hypothetical protein BpHYR1_027579, partial [Brachionus plicatilis]